MRRVMHEDTHVFRALAPAAAGTDDQLDGTGVNMRTTGNGFTSVAFAVLFGTITASAETTIAVQQSADDGSTDAYTTISGSEVTVPADGDDAVYFTDVVEPTKPWVRVIVTRATANAVVDGGVGHFYNGSGRHPVAQAATGEKVVTAAIEAS